MTMDLKVKRFFSFVKHIPKIKVQENEEFIRNFNENLEKNLMCSEEYMLLTTQEKYDKFCLELTTSAEIFRTKTKEGSGISTATRQEIEKRE